MRIIRLTNFAGIVLTCLLVLGAQTIASAQGRGRGGGGGGGGMGGGRLAGVGGGGPSMGSPGVDRGLGTASERSGSRSDRGLGNASENSRGRSDEGLNRARLARENSQRAGDDIREHPGVARMLHTSARDLRSQYEAALATNPNLKFGQFVAATRLSANLGSRNPAITREAILAGLANGDSIGRTLQRLGLSSREAKEAERQAEREIKEGRRRS
jgi:hypothetical protein